LLVLGNNKRFDLEVYTTESVQIVLKQYCAFDLNDPQLILLDARPLMIRWLKAAAAELGRCAKGTINARSSVRPVVHVGLVDLLGTG